MFASKEEREAKKAAEMAEREAKKAREAEEKAAREMAAKERADRISALETELELDTASIKDAVDEYTEMLEDHRRASVPHWEYLTLFDPDKDRLSQAGQAGWELVSAIVVPLSEPGLGNTPIVNHLRCFFKRPLIDASDELRQQMDEIGNDLQALARLKSELEELKKSPQ